MEARSTVESTPLAPARALRLGVSDAAWAGSPDSPRIPHVHWTALHGSSARIAPKPQWLASASRAASARAMMPVRPPTVDQLDSAWAMQSPRLADARTARMSLAARQRQATPPRHPQSVSSDTPRLVAEARERMRRNIYTSMATAGAGIPARAQSAMPSLALPAGMAQINPQPVPTLQMTGGKKQRYLALEAEAALNRKRTARKRRPMPRGPLNITASPDLSLDTRFDVLINSVPPEFASSHADSGLNRAIWEILSGYGRSPVQKVEKKKKASLKSTRSSIADTTLEAMAHHKSYRQVRAIPPPVQYDQRDFVTRNGNIPTYGDALSTELLPEHQATAAAASPDGTTLRFIVHALAPNVSSCDPKLLPTRQSKETAFATLVATYFRALWKATVLGGPKCSIGLPVLGSGESDDPEDLRRACCLAHSAYRATGGCAAVSMALDSAGTEGDSKVGPTGAKWTTREGGSETSKRKAKALSAELELWVVATERAPGFRGANGDLRFADEDIAKLVACLMEALCGSGDGLLLREVGLPHTQSELTILLEDRARLLRHTKSGPDKDLCAGARTFLQIRTDIAGAGTAELKAELAAARDADMVAGKWSNLFATLAEKAA